MRATTPPSVQRKGRGGKRPGAGRKPKGEKAGHPHTTRPGFATRMPVHVTWRMLPEVVGPKSRQSFRVVERSLEAAAEMLGGRLCEVSFQGDLLHLIVEADSQATLSRTMKGLGVRIARGLNGMLGRRGQVFAERYHAHLLDTPTELRRAVRAVRERSRGEL